MLDPKLAEKLMADVPEMREFIAFISEEADKLNQIGEIKLTTAPEIALEVLAKQKAYNTLQDILSPLLNIQIYDKIEDDEFKV